MIRLRRRFTLIFCVICLKDKRIHLSCLYDGNFANKRKYGTHSALNMFDEFSMIDPGPLAEICRFYRKKK